MHKLVYVVDRGAPYCQKFIDDGIESSCVSLQEMNKYKIYVDVDVDDDTS